ncbi:sigma-70 family RNA polymerase sigma factor [Chitinophaga horti]|uniref:Sigma-70 family RNA polymerase sigma factor n=1 Tax=Chitinophaga horti TaxID=2920382 RepID=A0ABY6J576_9BACT|nr:sigma-70 family RNA polymerase sigma factor [Chitinophaga horti]UYQ94833.1 sigma-70 family RNA polymerase sigma factor [Chitinophaga horti]
MDASTFETVFKKHYQLLCLQAYSMLNDEPAAKDLVQALFIDLWEKRAELDIRKDVTSYLWISVRNRCMTYQRNKANHDKKVAAHEQEKLPVAEEIRIRTDGPDIADKLAAAISDMPARRSLIFQMVYIQGLAYQQAADRLSISKNSIKTQIKIGLQHLRLKLGGVTWD